MGIKKLTVISTSDSSLESIQNSAISVANQKRRQDRSNNYLCDVFSVKHKTQFYAVDDDFVSIINSDGNILKSDYITSTKLGEELAKIPSSGTVTLDENRVNELINNKITTLDLDSKFNSKANVDDVYTKSEVDNNVATKDELNTKLDSSIYTTDKATYTTKNELSALVYTKSEVDEKVATISSGGSVSLDGFVRVDDIVNLATKDEVNAKLDSFTYTTDKDTFATKTQIEGKANKDEVYSKTEIDANYTTTEQLNLALTGKADKAIVDSLATKVEVNEEIVKLATKEEVASSLATKADSSVIPTLATKDELSSKVDRSELDAKANSSDILNLATKEEVNEINSTLTDAIATKANANAVVNLTGDQTIEGVKTFSMVPVVATQPTDDNQLANKAYVDSRAVSSGSGDTTKASWGVNWNAGVKLPTDTRMVAPSDGVLFLFGKRFGREASSSSTRDGLQFLPKVYTGGEQPIDCIFPTGGTDDNNPNAIDQQDLFHFFQYQKTSSDSFEASRDYAPVLTFIPVRQGDILSLWLVQRTDHRGATYELLQGVFFPFEK